jgi:Tol biopolymer transport system component
MKVARRTALAFALVLSSLAVLSAFAAAAAANPKTVRVSVRPNGHEINTDSEDPSLTQHGNAVAFDSLGQFTKHDQGTDADVFVWSRKSHKIKRVSVKSNGKEADGDSEHPSISANGRYVAFSSDAKLVGSDTNGVDDIYVHDRKTGKTVRASVQTNGVQSTAESIDPSISADGHWVAWDSQGAFIGADQNGDSDVYARNLKTGKTLLVSRENDGDVVGTDMGSSLGVSTNPSVSENGHFIAFQSDDQTMTADTDLPSFPPVLRDQDIFVRDIKNGTTIRVSLEENGAEADNGQQSNTMPSISADGTRVAFVADPNGRFLGTDTNSYSDVYVKRYLRSPRSLVLASVRTDGTIGDQNSGISTPPRLSDDARYVAFESNATLVANDADGVRDIYVHDNTSGKTKAASVLSNGQLGTADDQAAAISGDGNWVGFFSFGAYVGTDNGSDFDVFLRGPLH